MMTRRMCVLQAVGVSNYNADRIRKTAAFLKSKGIPLASNQVRNDGLYNGIRTSAAFRLHDSAWVSHEMQGNLIVMQNTRGNRRGTLLICHLLPFVLRA